MKHSIFILLLLSISTLGFSQSAKKNYKVGCIAFYNLENLFDTIDNPHVRDTEFTPNGPDHWTSERYERKIDHMSYAISQIGRDYQPLPPAIIGVSEIENQGVLDDLIKSKNLAPYHYKTVHYDSPDRRGIDVALLYMPSVFKVINTKSHRLVIPNDTSFRTRDQLMVEGNLDGDTLFIIVNHWPSRYGGEKRSRPFRNAAADLTRHIFDSIQTIHKNAKIIIMGDLNDDPINISIEDHLKAKSKIENTKRNDIYNPYYELFKKGEGSLAYRDKWNNFDQIMVSEPLLGKDKSSYKFYKAMVFNKPFLINQEGRYKGYPFRTFAGGSYAGGYSDHFPAYILLIKQVN